MRKPVTDTQDGFQGGLNTTADESQLAPNEIRTARNARLTIFGALQKRLGTTRTSFAPVDSAVPIRGGFSWKRPGSTTELVVTNGKLYVGTYAIPMTWTLKAGALDATTYPSFAPFRDAGAEVCYIADGGPLNKYDGGALTVNLAGTPNIARVAVQNQRLFGISGVDQTLYYSALNNGDTLGTGAVDSGSAVIRTFGNQELRAMLALGESLVLFHREGISRFTGYTSDDISLATGTRGISSDTGTIAPDSVVAVENTGYFLSDRGIYQVTEAGVEPISIKIESVINNLSPANFNRVKSVHHRAYREVWFYLPDVGCYVYNYRLRSWAGPMDGLFNTITTTHALWGSLDANGAPIALMGGADGFVRLIDSPGITTEDSTPTSGNNGSAITLACGLRRMYFGAPDEEKMFRRLQVQANLFGSTGYNVNWEATVGSLSYNITTNTNPVHEIQLGGRGTFLDVTIIDIGVTTTETSRVTANGVSYGRRYSRSS